MPANPSPLTAPTADDFRAWHRVQAAALAHDRPGEPIPTQDAVRAGLTTVSSGIRQVLWLVRGAGEDAMATAVLRLFDDPGRSHRSDVDMTVHPAHRRLGAGSRLLATVTEAAAAAGCRVLLTVVPAGTSGEGFLGTRGFKPVLRQTHLRLPVAEVPDRIRKLPEVPHPGYRLTAWPGVVPDALAAGFAAARAAMADLPSGAMDRGRVTWDEARVRDVAEVIARRGERLLTVAAVSESDGSVAGFTQLVVSADASAPARQHDTAVLPAHRGNGLGLWMKAEMLRRLRDEHPGVSRIDTNNADDNRHMLAINSAFGFRPHRRTVAYQMTLRRS
jgi:GNAT superfamily N-acetyltransferase